MQERSDTGNIGQGGRKLRKRLRGMLDTRTGRSLSIAGVAAPIVGMIAHDLQKPDSVIRGLISSGVKRLLTRKDRAMIDDVSAHTEIVNNERNK
jgi:hypothetical protein